jgi:hypothetical protein
VWSAWLVFSRTADRVERWVERRYGDDDQDYWMPYEVGQESAAAAHVEFWRSLHPSHDGEVLHAKLSEA